MEYNRESNINNLPNQRVSSKQKMTKSWQEKSMKFFIEQNTYSHREKRKSIEEMDVNWSIINSNPNEDELSDSFDPLGLRNETEFKDSPIKLQFYNIVNNPLNTLLGEELKRRNDIKAIVINQTAVNQKDKLFKEKMYEYLNNLAASHEAIEDKSIITDELSAIDKWRKHDLQTAHEVMVNQIINMVNHDTRINIKEKFNNAFKDLIYNGETIMRVGSIGKEPMVYNVDGRYFTVLGLGKSNHIEDGNAWIEEDYMNPHKIVEESKRKLLMSVPIDSK